MPPPTRAPAAALACTVLAVAVLAGCSSGPGDTAEDPSPTAHGYVEGAEETAEAQWRLVIADAATGEVFLLDPVTEEPVAVADVDGARQAATDGRFAYVSDGTTTHVIDSGAWTVDHGDHVHYYKTEPRAVGDLDTDVSASVGDPAVTVVNGADGPVALDRESLDAGEIAATATVEAQAALPYDQRLLAIDDGTVTVLERDGGGGRALAEDCPDPQSPTVTRRGAVFACADGALLVSGEGDLTAEKIPYPAGASVDGGLHHRPGTPMLAARTGDGGVLVLDLKAREWTALDRTAHDLADAVAVSATGEDSPVLVLTEDGVLRSFDPATGAALAQTELMAVTDGAAIQVDTARAYVSDPEGAAVHEIDYRDELRLARTFDLDFRPDLMVETGW
ncbi:hypothetical protein [Glycomyces artemisiae]|uniref:ABC transporter n=1 Tax=Glycomyces artemisiae TaxID=1076443 RepID=A0A2T0UPQ2_9ACTN|nr:hypothetical protein [Glycomyces artemisiae]PRY59905.1 hypothetical protein B0I28_103379 [Glycomyces artemisiae]